MFVGYQGEGTLGRSLLEGVRSVKLFGEEIAVHAKIVNFQGLSSHADRDHLLAWIADIKAPKPQHVFIVHGDREVAPYFAESVEKLGFTAHAPQYTEVYDLLEDKIVAPGYLPERKAKAVGGQRVSSAYERLVALGQRMGDVIRRSKGPGQQDPWPLGGSAPSASGQVGGILIEYLPAGRTVWQRGRCSPAAAHFQDLYARRQRDLSEAGNPNRDPHPVHDFPCRRGIANHLNLNEDKRDKSHGSIGKRQYLYSRY